MSSGPRSGTVVHIQQYLLTLLAHLRLQKLKLNNSYTQLDRSVSGIAFTHDCLHHNPYAQRAKQTLKCCKSVWQLHDSVYKLQTDHVQIHSRQVNIARVVMKTRKHSTGFGKSSKTLKPGADAEQHVRGAFGQRRLTVL